MSHDGLAGRHIYFLDNSHWCLVYNVGMQCEKGKTTGDVSG